MMYIQKKVDYSVEGERFVHLQTGGTTACSILTTWRCKIAESTYISF